jgi:lipopolysaccharide export system permease protein
MNFIKKDERVVFTLYNGEVHEVEKQNIERYRRMKFQKESISISVPDMSMEHSTYKQRGDREKSTKMLMEDIRLEKSILKEREEYIRKLVKLDFQELFPDEFSSQLRRNNESKPISQNAVLRIQRMGDQIESEANIVNGYRRSINSLWVEVHKKYSIPFACLVFVLIGAPLGILVRQSGFAAAGWLSIAFFLIYWAFLIGGEQLADRMILSPRMAMWSPNVFVGMIGLLLLIRALKESTLFPWSRMSKNVKNGKNLEKNN